MDSFTASVAVTNSSSIDDRGTIGCKVASNLQSSCQIWIDIQKLTSFYPSLLQNQSPYSHWHHGLLALDFPCTTNVTPQNAQEEFGVLHL